MPHNALRVENLSKQYRIAAAQYSHDTLRDQLVHSVASVFRRNGRGPHPRTETFWALKDVSFEVKQGEVVGIIGGNGAGKSTLLKILSRITEPTSGRADIYGRVGSLLEVGTGFDQELTGRENIYLSGAILGMRKAEIDRKFDEIVAFAEVDKFIDTPVKRYSSGMSVRLAFAVAAHLEPEILLVDEVLAVGDAAFQRKCLGKMGDVATRGRTILFVSHNMAAVTRLCKRSLWLDGGTLKASSDTESVVEQYLAAATHGTGEVSFKEEPPGSDQISLLGVRIRDSQGRPTASLDTRRPFAVDIYYRILRPATNLRIGLRLLSHDGVVILTSIDADSEDIPAERQPGEYVSRCVFPGHFLNYGHYFVSIGADTPMVHSHFLVDRALAFHVESTGGPGAHIADGRLGFLRTQFPWEIHRLSGDGIPQLQTLP